MTSAGRILFARIGQMACYAGPQIVHEKPRGGGKHNEHNLGHEAFNFHDFEGKLYGFVQPRIDLLKIDPTVSKNTTTLDNVMIIFVAPYDDGQRVVGWYKGAVLYCEPEDYPPRVKKQINLQLKENGWSREAVATFRRFRVEAPTANAVLLPKDVRMSRPTIPRTEKGGFGEYNVCYLYKNGKRKDASWIKDTTSFVRTYRGPNLLLECKEDAPSSEYDASDEEAILIAQERKAGFQSNRKIRAAVEIYAMERAKSELKIRGYRDFKNTSKLKSYDYTCRKEGVLYYVEVKGTQTKGDTVILTKNEVAHANENPDNSMIVIVHHVKVKDGNPPVTNGGEVDIHKRWSPLPNDLVALQYQWTTPRFGREMGGRSTST
jgi:hypothetical protein